MRNCLVYETPGSGIRFNDSDHMIIEDNVVHSTTWWSSSAESGIVYAESISQDGDNGDEVKMIMRRNVAYDNWNRIPFYCPSCESNVDNGTYGTAEQDYILDGQGLYVTRSDDSYAGTFLFENNVLFNNGKNGINFDHSDSAKGIYRNNTLYFNGVHNIVQDQSVADGNPRHVGNNKVAGINARNVTSIVVANNIVVTRENAYSALAARTAAITATNNIFRNGRVPDSQSSDSYLDVDPMFVNPSIDYSVADFRLKAGSPAIDAGNSAYSPDDDKNKISGLSYPIQFHQRVLRVLSMVGHSSVLVSNCLSLKQRLLKKFVYNLKNS